MKYPIISQINQLNVELDQVKRDFVNNHKTGFIGGVQQFIGAPVKLMSIELDDDPTNVDTDELYINVMFMVDITKEMSISPPSPFMEMAIANAPPDIEFPTQICIPFALPIEYTLASSQEVCNWLYDMSQGLGPEDFAPDDWEEVEGESPAISVSPKQESATQFDEVQLSEAQQAQLKLFDAINSDFMKRVH